MSVDQFIVQKGQLYKGSKIDWVKIHCYCISILVLSLAHRPGHLGRDKTTRKELDDFCWPGLHREVKQVCRVCPDCQKADNKAPFPTTLCPLSIINVSLPADRNGYGWSLTNNSSWKSLYFDDNRLCYKMASSISIKTHGLLVCSRPAFADAYQSWCTRTDIDRLW